jgi:hypothetical protein
MESSVRSRAAKFKQLRHFTAVALLVLVCAACADSGRRGRRKTPLRRSRWHGWWWPRRIPTTICWPSCLPAKWRSTRTDLPAASAYYGNAMMRAAIRGWPNACQAGHRVHDSAAAQRAIDRWQALGASHPRNMAEARAELALDHGDADEARRQLELLRHGRQGCLASVRPRFAGRRDQAQAARLLETLATPQRLPADPQGVAGDERAGRQIRPACLRHADRRRSMQAFRHRRNVRLAAQMKFKDGDQAGASALLQKAIAKAPQNIQLRLTYASVLSQAATMRGNAHCWKWSAERRYLRDARCAGGPNARTTKALAEVYSSCSKRPQDVRIPALICSVNWPKCSIARKRR